MTPEETDAMRGECMSALMTTKREDDGIYLADLLRITDLWLIIEHLSPVILNAYINSEAKRTSSAAKPAGLTPLENMVWDSRDVREAIRDRKKINAIKEARVLTGMSLVEAKTVVEQMEKDFAMKTKMGLTWSL